MAKLTIKQELFIKHYLVNKNATQAALLSGYSEKTADKIGSENLKKPEIASAIQVHLNKTHEKLDITVERIQEELGTMAFQDMSKTDELHGLRHSDKSKALELLGKNKAMFTDKIEGKLTGNLAVTVTVKGHKV